MRNFFKKIVSILGLVGFLFLLNLNANTIEEIDSAEEDFLSSLEAGEKLDTNSTNKIK